MRFFPFSLINYAKANGIPIGWNDYLENEAPVAPFTAEGNIAIEKLSGISKRESPEYETWVIGVIIRHKDFPTLTADTTGLVDRFLAFVKGLRKTVIDEVFDVEDKLLLIDNEDVISGKDEYYYYINTIEFRVINKKRR